MEGKCGAVAVLNLKHSNHERERQWDCEKCTLTARKEHTKTLVFKFFFEYGSLPKLTQDGSVDTKGIEKRIASGEMRGSTSCGEGAHLQMVTAT